MTKTNTSISDQDLDALIAEMTLDEKVQMLSGELDFFEGMKALLKDDHYHTRPFGVAANERLNIPGLHFIDGPRGVVLFGGATTFPVSMARGASWDPDLEERIGDAIGKELRAMGGNLFGGVCINLLRHPAWGRAQETYGEDPLHVGEIGSGLVRGIERHAIACVKHYAANSMENARFQVDIQADQRTLHEVYLPHFKDCVDAGARSVMSAYNAVNGEWCGQDETLLNDILKKRWGFKGFVITDFIFGMRDPQKAIENGLDLEMPFTMVWGYKLRNLVQKGKVDEALLDNALRRAIRPQFEIPPQELYPKALIGAQEHKDLSREAATKSMVLLKNDNEFLPLSPDKKTVVIGKLARIANLGDHGSSDTRPDHVITPLEGLQSAFNTEVLHFDDIDVPGAKDAVKTAEAVIIVTGYTFKEEGEFIAPPNILEFSGQVPLPKSLQWAAGFKLVRGIWEAFVRRGMKKDADKALEQSETGPATFGRGGDRQILTLKPSDENMIAQVCDLNANTLVSVMGGSSIIMENWRDEARAIMMMWYPGMEGGHAFADLVTGRANPSGKLPFVIPTDAAHLPDFDIDAKTFTYDLWHGHRMLARDENIPAFPFGFGLSYSAFKIDNFSTEQSVFSESDMVPLRVQVSNRGSVDGDEVIQIYAQALGSSVERAPIQLASFKRIHVPAGQSIDLTIELPLKRIAYFDTALDDFVVEKIEYELTAAAHSLDQNGRKLKISVA